MFSKPKNGWCTITIGEWSDRCSYLDDVPFMVLEGLEESCRTHKPVAAKFDAEGWEYIIVFDWLETHIISDIGGKYELVTVDVNRDELALQAISDIRRDIDGWASWLSYSTMSDDEKEERKKDLLVLCDILSKRLPSDDYKLVYAKEGAK